MPGGPGLHALLDDVAGDEVALGRSRAPRLFRHQPLVLAAPGQTHKRCSCRYYCARCAHEQAYRSALAGFPPPPVHPRSPASVLWQTGSSRARAVRRCPSDHADALEICFTRSRCSSDFFITRTTLVVFFFFFFFFLDLDLFRRRPPVHSSSNGTAPYPYEDVHLPPLGRIADISHDRHRTHRVRAAGSVHEAGGHQRILNFARSDVIGRGALITTDRPIRAWTQEDPCRGRPRSR